MSDPEPILNHCPDCRQVIDVSPVRPFSEIHCPVCRSLIRVRTQFGKFTLLSEIGEGGMSRVFLARDNNLDRDVALKILHHHYGDHPELLTQFEKEARVTASINHPNVVQVYSVGRDQGYFFIAMELLKSESLDDEISSRGRIDQITALRILHEVTLGLAAANQANLIHRDIKPGNILLDQQGTAKLVDFGLAIVQGAEEDPLSEVWATPFYVPPEKLRGAPDSFRGDLYSLGATFFHALSGSPPHAVNTTSMDELLAIKAKPAQLNASALHLAPGTADLIHRLMAFRPEFRFQSYAECLDAIRALREKVDPGYVSSTSRRSFPLWAGIAGGTLAALFVGGLLLLVSKGSSPGGGTADAPASGGGLDSPREVTLSARESAQLRQLRSARLAFEEGSFDETAFTSLAADPSASPSLRAWSEFHLGMHALDRGDPTGAESHFETATALASEAGDPAAPLMAALRASATSPGRKRLEDLETYDLEDPFPGFLSLALGLLNWSRGDFTASVPLLERFLNQDFPVEFAWSGGFIDSAKSRLQDLKILASLPAAAKLETPDPGLSELEERVAASESALAQLRHEGTREEAVKHIATLRDEIARRTERMRTAALEKERSALAETAASLEELALEGDFATGAEAWRTLETPTPEGRRIAEDSAAAWEQAGRFPALLAESIGSHRYEGEILRRTGRPFRAKILRADDTQLFIDLGFGPTPLKLSALSNRGILQIAQATVLTAANAELLQCAACYAWLSGEPLLGQELALKVERDEAFLRRWKALTEQK